MKTEYLIPTDVRGYAIKFRLPRMLQYWTYVDEHTGDWVVEVEVEAVDVETGGYAYFKTSWRGARPSDHAGEREMIALTIGNALRHEVKEQLGMKPHGDNT